MKRSKVILSIPSREVIKKQRECLYYNQSNRWYQCNLEKISLIQSVYYLNPDHAAILGCVLDVTKHGLASYPSL